MAFEKLKVAMVNTPVLALPNFSEPFTLETDACDSGVGAVLMQNNRPIAFFSKSLAASHQHLSIYEKEFLALMMAIEKWRQYLQQNEFIIQTDHKSLTYLGDQQTTVTIQDAKESYGSAYGVTI